MAYVYHQWANNEDITPEKMNNIERGIVDLHRQASPQNVEKTSNKATSVTDEQNKYPSASAVRDYFINKTTTSYATNMRITSSPTKTRYINGENIDLTGILAECVRRAGVYSLSQTGQPYSYEQNLGPVSIPSSEIVAVPKKAYIDGMAPDQNQTFEYKVSWYDDVTHTTISTSATATVTTYTVKRIAIQDSSNVKKEYVQNEAIDLTGLVVNGYDVNNELLVNGIDTSDLTPAPSVAYIAGLGEYEEAQLTVQVNYEEPLYHNIYTVSYEVTVSPEGWTICNVEILTNQNILNFLEKSENGSNKLKSKTIVEVSDYAADSYSLPTYSALRLGGAYFLNCETIGTCAFRNCIYLSKAIFPSCQELGKGAFYSCKRLNEISFPKCYSIGSSCFMSCSELISAIFPYVLTVDSSAFYDCIALENISLLGVSTIEEQTFYSCHNLKSASFPNCTIIKDRAFTYCYSLTEADFPICTQIGEFAFGQCNNLSLISFPECQIIWDGAFDYCKLINASFSKCTIIYSDAFAYCTSLTSISFPNCSQVYERGFYYDTNLTSVYLPICRYIGSSTFYNCYNLQSISLPSCTMIMNYGFNKCSNLATVSIPLCYTIGDSVFQQCSSLNSITLPKIYSIFSYAFKSCINLESIYLTGSSKCLLKGESIFYNTPITKSSYLGYYGSIYVPSSLYNDYINDSNWSYYSDRIVSM